MQYGTAAPNQWAQEPHGGPEYQKDRAAPPPQITVQSQIDTLESYVSQFGELCGRASALGDRLVGSYPAASNEAKGNVKAIPNGIIDRIDALSREFSGMIGRMERELQRIGDSL